MLLQRTLAVDADVRAKWNKAYEKHETECERLGSLTLLSQGIFAFKADGAGGQTDLIFPEFPDQSALVRSVDGLVLTEWKLATRKDARAKFRMAYEQAKTYKQGVLGGVELAGYRYLIVVSEKDLQSEDVPTDFSENGVVYRHINIVINPDLPSVRSRKLATVSRPGYP
jgi:hypothetical protein